MIVSPVLRRAIVGILLLIAVLIVQFERASRRREAKLRPLPFRVVTTPPPSDAEKAPFYAIEDLGVIPGHNHSFSTSINAAGQVVGISETVRPFGLSSRDEAGVNAFLWTDGRMIDLGIGFRPEDIDDTGRVVGSDADFRPCRWSHGIVSPLLAGAQRYGRATAVNEQGWVVGAVIVAGGPEHAFFSVEGSLKDLGTLGGIRSSAADVNRAGDVVGTSGARPDWDAHPASSRLPKHVTSVGHSRKREQDG